MLMDGRIRIINNSNHSRKSYSQIQCNPNQNPHIIFHRNRKIFSKVRMESQKTLDIQNNPKQNELC